MWILIQKTQVKLSQLFTYTVYSKNNLTFFEILLFGAGEIAQEFRTLAAFPENPGLIPSPHMLAYNQL